MRERLRWAATVVVVTLVAGCSAARPTTAATELKVPHREFSGYVDTVAVRSTLEGIEVSGRDACPWVEDLVLLVFTTDASVDPSGRVLISYDHRIAIGDEFETAPQVKLASGYECGGKHWDHAVQLPGPPKPVG